MGEKKKSLNIKETQIQTINHHMQALIKPRTTSASANIKTGGSIYIGTEVA